MPKVSRVLETCLYVDDVERSAGFYERLFGFKALDRDARFCSLSVNDEAVLLLFRKGATTREIATEGGVIPPHDGNGSLHLAFSIAAEEYEPWKRQLENRAIPIESEVHWTRGGKSLYFRDPDDHLIELVTPGCWSIY
ncbi:MAG: VOC family protein [Acidobacteriota bacterium]